MSATDRTRSEAILTTEQELANCESACCRFILLALCRCFSNNFAGGSPDGGSSYSTAVGFVLLRNAQT